MTQHARSTPRRLRRLGIVLAVGAAALLFGAGTASAHVSITNEPVTPGGYSTVNFRVPNESDTASTTKVEIQLPADTPFGFVSAGQAPGWTVTTTETTFDSPITVGTITVDKAITAVTFTADGTGLPPGQFVVFDLLLGPIPNVSQLQFGAVQTYDDGEVVNWTEPTPAGGEEPEHPAPVLEVSATDTATEQTPSTSMAAPDTADTTARVLGIAGIVVGLAGVGTGLFLARGRRRPTGTGTGTAA